MTIACYKIAFLNHFEKNTQVSMTYMYKWYNKCMHCTKPLMTISWDPCGSAVASSAGTDEYAKEFKELESVAVVSSCLLRMDPPVWLLMELFASKLHMLCRVSKC